MSRTTYTTTPLRAVLGLIAGATTASLTWIALAYGTARMSGSQVDIALAETVVVVTPATYVVGLALIGAPVWALLHAKGSRTPADAAATGVALSAALASPLALLSPVLVLIPALIGAPVGLVIWRVAYRRAV